MKSCPFDPLSPPSVGAEVRINAGQFKGYEGKLTRIDKENRQVRFTIEVFERPIELVLDFVSAAEILDVLKEDNRQCLGAEG